MNSWIARLVALTGLLGGLLVASATTPAQADYRWCADVADVGPCIVSLKKDGVLVTDPTSINRDTYSGDDANHYTGFTITNLTAADLGHTYEVVMKTGDIRPRVVSGWGKNVHTVRYGYVAGNWSVKVTLEPVHMLNSCHNPAEPYCPTTGAPGDVRYEAQAQVSDAVWYSSDPVEADKLNGFEQFSNINLFWYPPTITRSSTGVVTMDFLMENSHFWPDGTTVFHGFANVRLPNPVLRRFYGIPNPETMVDGSFTSTSSTGTVNSYQETGDDAWRIDVTGVTFSKRHLKLTRGTIRPTRPRDLHATRLSATTGRIGYTLSKPRGAKVTGYQARCASAGGHVVFDRKYFPTSPIRVDGLHRGTSYTCKVRASSRGGWSLWSLGVRMPAHP